MNPRTRTRVLLAAFALAAASAAGCELPGDSGSGGATPPGPQPHTLLAEYEGVIPCASCPGIRMRLRLYADTALFHLTETYLATGGADSVFESEGTWTTLHGMEGNPDAIVYQLNPGDPEAARSFVVVDDSEIQMLDREQRRIVSEQNYSLSRLPLPPDPLGGKTWMWVELVTGSVRREIEHPERYTIRTGSPGDLTVQADCNQGRARYKMSGDKIAMGPLAMTFAMCAEGSRGDEFARMLGEAVRLEIASDTLEVGLREGGEMRMVVGP